MAQTILELQLKGVKEAQADMQRLSEEIVKQKQRQAELKTEMKATEKAFKDGEISQEDYTKAMAQMNIEQTKSKKIVSENTSQLKQNIRVVNAQEGSLDQLRASLNLLQKEYGQLNKETDEGAAKALEMSEQIERLTLEVKSQEKAIGDTRRNVGNYEEAIQSAIGSMMPFGNQFQTIVTNITNYNTQVNQATQNTTNMATVVPQASSAFKSIGSAITGATRAAIAFIATPIGAAITALAAIGAATKAWFDYNNEIRETNQLLAGITDQTGDTLDNIRRQTAAIEETLGVGAEESAKAAKVLVEQFGISYEEALDKMQTGILATNGANDELLASISEYSTFFADAGFSVDEFTSIVNAGFDLGIYTDKLPDALKEADISLREQTKATTEALTNAFGEEFTGDILNQINIGALSTKDALTLISLEAEKVGLTAEQAATLTADVFRGAGEDAGGALKVFEAVAVGVGGASNELDEYGKSLEKEIGRTVEMAEEMDEALMSPNFIAFQETLAEIGHAFKMIVVDALSFVMDALKPVGEAFSSLGEALGFSGDSAIGLADILGFLTKAALLPLKGALVVITNVAEFLTGVINFAKTAFNEVGTAVTNATNKFPALKVVVDKISAAFEVVRESAAKLVGGLKDALRFVGLLDESGGGTGFFERLGQQASAASSESTDAISELGGAVAALTSNLNDASDAADDAGDSTDNYTRSVDEAAKAEERRLKTLSDIIDKEEERNMTAKELLTERLNDKLRELELDKDITEMTEQELAAREALLAKYNDDVEKLIEAGKAAKLAKTKEEFDENLKAINDALKIEMLVKETALLNELRNEKLTEEQKLALQEQFQNESLELQRDALIKQIELIESTLGDGETTAALEQLRKSLAGINLEIANAGKDEDGEDKPLAERLGLEPEQVERIKMGIQGVEAGLDAMSQLVEARAAERFGKVEQLLQQGVINEEEAERRKEQIKKDAARKQQKIDVTQAVINTAKAVTSALNTQPFLPAGLIMAGIATAQGAAQIKMIRSQKFAKGGILNGPSHAQGGIPMFSKGGAFYGEAEGGEAVLTKGVMANPALARMASAINVAGGGVPFFANGGVLEPIQSATPTDRAADIIATGMKSRQPVLVVEQLRERENSVDVIESLRTIG